MSSPFIPCLLDLQKFLSGKDFLCDWKLHTCLPAPQSAIADWESRHCCQLPPDLKAFYQTSDGLHFSYSARCGEAKSRIGACRVNSLDGLRPVVGGHCDLGQEKPSLADVDADDAGAAVSMTAAARGDCRVFELEPLEWPGHVCLVMPSGGGGGRAGVFLLDRAMHFHRLADSFQAYYALALVHLGLHQWQLCLTDIGPTPGAREWLCLLAPLRLEIDEAAAATTATATTTTWEPPVPETNLDRDRVFRGKPSAAAAAASAVGDKKRAGGGAQGTPQVARGGAPNPVRRFAASTKAAMAKSAAPLVKK